MLICELQSQLTKFLIGEISFEEAENSEWQNFVSVVDSAGVLPNELFFQTDLFTLAGLCVNNLATPAFEPLPVET